MNKVILCGRLVRDPDIRYGKGDPPLAFANFTLAVQRRRKAEGQPTADYISCKAFGKIAENCGQYLKQGAKINVEGAIQTGSYTNRDGQNVYTTEVVLSDFPEFLELKGETDYQYDENDLSQSGYQVDASMPKHTRTQKVVDGNMSQKREWVRGGGNAPVQPTPRTQKEAPPAPEEFMQIPDDAMDDFPFN